MSYRFVGSDVPIGIHCHDNTGCAVANSMAAERRGPTRLIEVLGPGTFATLAAIEAIQPAGGDHVRVVVLIEATEEPGSPDPPAYVEALADRIGSPSSVVCLWAATMGGPGCASVRTHGHSGPARACAVLPPVRRVASLRSDEPATRSRRAE